MRATDAQAPEFRRFRMKLTTVVLALTLGASLAGTAGATVVNLTSANSAGILNGGIFVEGGEHPTGTGVFNPFLKYQPGGNQASVQGYNTDKRNQSSPKTQYDEQNAANWNHSLMLSDIPLFNCDASFMPGCTSGAQYRQFKLDLNASANDPLLSLDRVVIYDRNAGNLFGGNATEGSPLGATTLFTGVGDTLVYDSGNGNRVDLNYLLEGSGSGKSDMFLYIPDALFTGGPFVYLYSEFGRFETKKTAAKNEGTCTGSQPGPFTCAYAQDDTSGFEEWGVDDPTHTSRVPEPASIVLFGSSLLGLAVWGRKRIAR